MSNGIESHDESGLSISKSDSRASGAGVDTEQDGHHLLLGTYDAGECRLLFAGILPMDDVLLGGSIDGFVRYRENFDGLGVVAGLHEILHFFDLGLHAGFERLTARTALLGLTSVSDGSFQNWHRKE